MPVEYTPKSNHKAVLRRLERGETLYFQIIASIDGTQVMSDVHSFTLQGTPKPRITRHEIQNLTYASVDVLWQCNTPSKVVFWYLEAAHDDAPQHFTGTGYDRVGKFTMTGLKPETTYYYGFIASNELGEEFRSKPQFFTTREINYAYQAAVSGTFTNRLNDPGWTPEGDLLNLLVDDTIDYFTSMAVSGSVSNEEQFIIIDLGEPKEIGRVQIFWRGRAFSRDYSIAVSTDGENWELKAEHESAQDTPAIRMGTDNVRLKETLFSSSVTSRYVKITIPQGSDFYNYWIRTPNMDNVHIYEIKVLPLLEG